MTLRSRDRLSLFAALRLARVQAAACQCHGCDFVGHGSWKSNFNLQQRKKRGFLRHVPWPLSQCWTVGHPVTFAAVSKFVNFLRKYRLKKDCDWEK
eukprot:324503-Rhodomonas_salina.1